MLEAGVVALSEIVLLPRNPKLHDVPAILRSIAEVDFLERIVINRETGHLISGHGCVKALGERKAAGDVPPGNVQAQGDDGARGSEGGER